MIAGAALMSDWLDVARTIVARLEESAAGDRSRGDSGAARSRKWLELEFSGRVPRSVYRRAVAYAVANGWLRFYRGGQRGTFYEATDKGRAELARSRAPERAT